MFQVDQFNEPKKKKEFSRLPKSISVNEEDALKAVERLLIKGKQYAEKRETILFEKSKADADYSFKPNIAEGSKRIMEEKRMSPLYTKERQIQLMMAKESTIEKIKQMMDTEVMEKEQREVETSIMEKNNISMHRLKEYNDVAPRVFENKKSASKPTSIELERIEHCSFAPQTDQKSNAMLKQTGKVEDRLLKYNDAKNKKIEELTKVLSPKFKPQINDKKEEKNNTHSKLNSETKKDEISISELKLEEKLKEIEKYGNPFSMDDVKVMLEYKN